MNRVHIDAPAGIIDVEGERDFVEGLLVKLLPLIEESGFGTQRQTENVDQDAATESTPPAGVAAPIEPEKSKPKRRRGAATPKGQSCADRILALKADGFFKQHKGIADIVDGLKIKGFTHNRNQVAAAGESLFTRGLIQRTKEGNGPFLYYWDRD